MLPDRGRGADRADRSKLIEQAEHAPTGEERTQQALEAFLKLIAAQPAASKMCFVEVYAAGPRGGGGGRADARRLREVRHRALRADPGPRGDAAADGAGDDRRPAEGRPQAPLPRRSRTQLRRAGAADLEVVALLSAAPRAAARRRGAASQKPRPFEERQAVANPAERVLRALAAIVAEKGYPATTVAEIVDRASTSQRTFYEHFANKEEALLAALDSGSAQMLASVLPAFRRAPDWEQSVRAAYEAMFAFGTEEPEYTPPRRGRDVRGGQTGAADARHDHGRARGAARARATSWRPTPRRSPPRRSAARSTR